MKIPGASAVLTGIALVAFVSLFTLFADCSGSLYAGVGFSDPPVAIFTDEGGVAVFAVNTVLTVKPLQSGKVVQIQPDFVADIAPLQGVFVYTELRCLSVSAVCAFLPGGPVISAIATRFRHSSPS